WPRTAVAFKFLHINQHFTCIEAHPTVLARPVGRDPALGVELAPPALHLVPARALQDEAQLGGVFALDESAHLAAEILVALRVVVGNCGRSTHVVAPLVSCA